MLPAQNTVLTGKHPWNVHQASNPVDIPASDDSQSNPKNQLDCIH